MKKQKAQILERLRERGHITPVQAMTDFNCMRLGARIWDLRQEGWEIVTVMINGKREGVKYAQYVLDMEQRYER